MDIDSDDNILFEKLARLQWLLARQHMQGHLERGPFADTSRGQGRVLALLKMQPEISTKDLSYLMGIRHQSLNELLNKLEKSGYITRTPSEADRRVTMVSLTEKGKNEQPEKPDCAGIFDCLAPEEQSAFSEYLDRLIAALESLLGIDEDCQTQDWMKAARLRMGNEMFDRLMSMRGGFGAHYHGPHDRPFHGGFDDSRHVGHRNPPPPPHPSSPDMPIDLDDE